MPDTQLFSLSATDLVAGFARGDFSPVDVAESVLARIEVVQPQTNAFAHVLAESARSSAAASERRWGEGRPAGPIDGVPVTIKENVPVAGIPMTMATRAFDDAAPATVDGPPAARTVEAGGVVVGVTTMPEFAMLSSGVSTLHGITRNPLDLTRTVGGSSGGAAAAAAGGCGPLHGGSDIGGSLRFPAAWTGTTTLKPSWGRLPVDPPYIGRTIGAIARTVADVALYTSVLAGADARDYTALEHRDLPWLEAVREGARGELGRRAGDPERGAAGIRGLRAGDPGRGAASTRDLSTGDPERGAGGIRGLRIGLHTDAGCGLPTDPEIIAAVTSAAALFEQAGAVVEPLPPFMAPELLNDLDMFFRVRSYADIVAYAPERRERILPYILQWIEPAAAMSGADVIRHYSGIQTMRARTVAATLPYDLVLSPVAAMTAFAAEQPAPDPDRQMDHLNWAAPYNFSEQPAGSITCGFSSTGAPIALQIAGRRFDDLGVLRAMAWFEQARGPQRAVDWAALDAVAVFPSGP